MNWVTNIVSVKGKKEEIEKLINWVSTPLETFSFAKIYDIPPEQGESNESVFKTNEADISSTFQPYI